MDTVHLWSNAINDLDMEGLAAKLSNPRLITDLEGSISVYGHLDNLRVGVRPGFISIKGSLPVFLHGDNLHLMTRADTERAAEKLSDLLHIKADETNVSRVDIGYNLLTRHKPRSYFPYLLDSRHYFRQANKSTLYYTNKSSQFCIYDKAEEAKSKKVKIPDIYAGKNLIRLEYRALKEPAKQVKSGKLYLKSLYDEKIYVRLVDKWADMYNRIRKAPKLLSLKSMNISKPKDLKNQLAAMTAQHLGYDALMAMLEEAKNSHVFRHENYYNRAKAEIMKLLTMQVEGSSFEMTEELDKQVRQIKQYCR